MQIDPPADTAAGTIDEGLYSRQLYVYSIMMCLFTGVYSLMRGFFEATFLVMRP